VQNNELTLQKTLDAQTWMLGRALSFSKTRTQEKNTHLSPESSNRPKQQQQQHHQLTSIHKIGQQQ
jgi:hypothetical protein